MKYCVILYNHFLCISEWFYFIVFRNYSYLIVLFKSQLKAKGARMLYVDVYEINFY